MTSEKVAHEQFDEMHCRKLSQVADKISTNEVKINSQILQLVCKVFIPASTGTKSVEIHQGI